MFTSILKDYIVDGKDLIIRGTARPLSGDFDKYVDCLNFAKKYVADFIKLSEPEQLEISV